MPRLSITLTESQATALERIAAETGATKQSMIGLAVSAWIRENDVQPAREHRTPQTSRQGLAGWYGWCRTWTEEQGSRDVDRQRFATEHEAIAHAKAVALDCKERGISSAHSLWEECNEDGIPVALL